MNVIQIVGNLGADAEVRFTADGTKIISFNIATTIYRNGKEETVWYRISAFGDRFDKLVPYLLKGKAILVVGELHPRTYQDKEGNTRMSLDIRAEVIRFSPFKERRDEQQGTNAQPQAGTASGSFNYGQGQQQNSGASPALTPQQPQAGTATTDMSQQMDEPPF